MTFTWSHNLIWLVAIHVLSLRRPNNQSLGVYHIIEQALEIIHQLMVPVVVLGGLRH